MNYLDIIIIIPLGIAVFRGLRKGLIIELALLASLFAGVFAGIYFSDFIAELLIKSFGLNAVYTKAVAFTLIFIAVIILVRFIAKTIEKMVDLAALSFANKILGALFSALKIAFLLSVVFFLFNRFDTHEKVITAQSKEKSLLYKPVSLIAPVCIPKIKSEIAKWQAKDSIPPEKQQEKQ
ncbi:MAG TPA: CvpA family protein [Bacteroidales bacterium]|nr:CvpA family protein [Bacteroidales bacterium]